MPASEDLREAYSRGEITRRDIEARADEPVSFGQLLMQLHEHNLRSAASRVIGNCWACSSSSVWRSGRRLSGDMMRVLIAASIVSVISGYSVVAKAQAVSFCTAITDADPESSDGALTLGRILPGPPASLSLALPTTCPGNLSACQGLSAPQIKTGEMVAVGQSQQGFVCVHGSGLGEDGWIKASRVVLMDPANIRTPLSAWVGTWSGISQASAVTMKASHGQLNVWLETKYPNRTSEDQKIACAAESAVPKGSLLIIKDQLYHECNFRLILVGVSLVVTASDGCTGGSNLKYGSFYILDKKAKPVKGQC
jgi:hypothetical protein